MQETITEQALERIQMQRYKQTFWVRKNSSGAIIAEATADTTEDGEIRRANLKTHGFEIDQRKR